MRFIKVCEWKGKILKLKYKYQKSFDFFHFFMILN